MKIILLHNANAGSGNRPDADKLLAALREAGHSVTYQSTKEKGAKWTMLESADLVVAAGGDGTVRKAAFAVAGRQTPLAILPLGTANNLAKTFGIPFDIDRIIPSLNTAPHKALDLGIAQGPWGQSPFIESAGAGLLPKLISHAANSHADQAPSVQNASEQFLSLLETLPAFPCTFRVDGREFTERLLLVEAMNIRSAGPNLSLAPDNDPGDGLLDFVFLKEASRAKFAEFLKTPTSNGPIPLEIIRGRTLSIYLPQPVAMHADDTIWLPEGQEDDSASSGPVAMDIRVARAPIEVLVPAA